MSAGGKPLVIQTEHLDPEPAAWLAQRCDYHQLHFEDPTFDELIGQAAGLVVRTYTQVNRALLERAPALRVIGRAGVALENIDIPACRSRGIEVVHAPGANTQSVVELVFAFMLDALRPRVFIGRGYALDEWSAARKELIGERQLADCTLGIVGFGRIGSRIAQVARAMGMTTIYTDVREIDEASRSGARPAELDDTLAHADIITFHVDDRPENHRFIGAEQLALVKDDALLINTSRGFILDPAALAGFLSANPRAQAILDVHDPEPVPEGDPLLALGNCQQSPHIGAATATAHRNMSWVVRDVWRVLQGEQPEYPAPQREAHLQR